MELIPTGTEVIVSNRLIYLETYLRLVYMVKLM